MIVPIKNELEFELATQKFLDAGYHIGFASSSGDWRDCYHRDLYGLRVTGHYFGLVYYCDKKEDELELLDIDTYLRLSAV